MKGSFAKRCFDVDLEKAEAGNISKAATIGVYYRSGYGTKKDPAKALEWLKKADNAGDPYGAFHLAEMHDQGEGVDVDYSEAFRLYLRAVDFDQNNSLGLREEMRLAISKRLSELYREGLGTLKNDAEAARWANIFKQRTEGKRGTLNSKRGLPK